MASPTEEWLCAAYLSGSCRGGEDESGDCSGLHHDMPYLWQAHLKEVGWSALPWDGSALEKAYCQPGVVNYSTQILLTYSDGEVAVIPLQVDFQEMAGELQHPSTRWPEQRFLNLRRLSTQSYAAAAAKTCRAALEVEREHDLSPALCPWRWYHDDGASWKLFEEDELFPMQWVLESKFLAGQRIYQFEVDLPWGRAKQETATFRIDFAHSKMHNLRDQHECSICRRPLFVSPDLCVLRKFPPIPPTRPIACSTSELPVSWFPVDQKADYELVPLSRHSFLFHLVASEFLKSSHSEWKILDIYRLQNCYLWHKFNSKKQHMMHKNKKANELLLFHGTATEVSVHAICRQNFDWRLCGKNGTAYGDGSYFARDASLSDGYTKGENQAKVRWMFLARILVGRYIEGVRGGKRPSPLDHRKPYGDLYDSCVNNTTTPTIYVIFENDQCYPEYVIRYTHQEDNAK